MFAADLDTSVESLRPYLRAWYNGARDMMEDAGLDIAGTDDPDTVRAELAKIGQVQEPNATLAEDTPDPVVSDPVTQEDATDAGAALRRVASVATTHPQ